MESTAPVAEPASSIAANPVMDVMPPPASAELIATPSNEEESSSGSTAKPIKDKDEVADQTKKPIKSRADKQKNKSVYLAILATVVIVLCLSSLATYAYIKTN